MPHRSFSGDEGSSLSRTCPSGKTEKGVWRGGGGGGAGLDSITATKTSTSSPGSSDQDNARRHRCR